MAAGDHPRPDPKRYLEHLEEGTYARLWGRHYPRGCQGAGTRAGPLRLAIHGLWCIRPEAHGQGTRKLPKTAKKLDAKFGTHADSTGPVGTVMGSYNSVCVSGFVVGAFGEVPMQFRDLTDLVACELSAEHLAPFGGAMNESKQMFTQRVRRSIGLAVHRGWANLLLDGCRDLVQDPRQPRTHTRGTDEDDAEAHEYFHFHQARGRGGHHRTRQG